MTTEERFQLATEQQRFRVVSQDCVLEEGTATLVSERHGVEQANYLVVHVRKQGVWYRDSVREMLVTPAASSSKLGELDWLLGEWKYQNEKGSTEIRCERIYNDQFLARTFKLQGQDGDEVSGTQIIGWDPSTRSIRSWSFDVY